MFEYFYNEIFRSVIIGFGTLFNGIEVKHSSDNSVESVIKVPLSYGPTQKFLARMEQEALIKKQLMAEEFSYNMQLAQIQASATTKKEQEIEDRKDKRVKIQGTQQSELIDQRKNDLLPKDFESAGNDNLSGFGLEQFEPR